MQNQKDRKPTLINILPYSSEDTTILNIKKKWLTEKRNKKGKNKYKGVGPMMNVFKGA